MNYEKLHDLKEFIILNKKDENRININDVDFLLQLKPKEFFCNICKSWHKWDSDSLINLYNNNLPYYYICNCKENSINITRKFSIPYKQQEFMFDLDLYSFSSESFEFRNFYFVSNILFYINDRHFGKCIDFFALKFDEENVNDILNIKKLYTDNKKLNFPNSMIYLKPIEFLCPICGKVHIWNGKILQKYTFNNPYEYICSFSKSNIKIFIFKYSICIIANSILSNNDSNKKLYIIKSLNTFVESKENNNTICYKSYCILKNEANQLGFSYNKDDAEKLNYRDYLNGLTTKSYNIIKLTFNPDIFKLVPIKFLCPICGKWHNFKSNYLFQNSTDLYRVTYEQTCPYTNSIITVEKRFYDKYYYTISINNIYKFLGMDTISILNFTKDDVLPRIYGTLYFKELNGKTDFGLEFNELDFNKLVNKEPKYDITSYDNAINKSYILATPYGIGTYDDTYAYIYDCINKKVIHYKFHVSCENYLSLGNGMNENIQKVPVFKSYLNIGDSIYYNEKLYFVHEICKNTLVVMDPFTSDTFKISPYISENGNEYYIKLFMLSDIPEYILPKLWEKFK